MINRRGFLIGLIAAPAIVRITSIMPVKSMPIDSILDDLLYQTRHIVYRTGLPITAWRELNMGVPYVKSP